MGDGVSVAEGFSSDTVSDALEEFAGSLNDGLHRTATLCSLHISGK
jgi:hypothetical protein